MDIYAAINAITRSVLSKKAKNKHLAQDEEDLISFYKEKVYPTKVSENGESRTVIYEWRGFCGKDTVVFTEEYDLNLIRELKEEQL